MLKREREILLGGLRKRGGDIIRNDTELRGKKDFHLRIENNFFNYIKS